MESLKRLIRDIPDFPRPGVVFKDFTPLLADPGGLALAVELMVNPFRGAGVDLVIGAESRGFIFGTAVAQALSAGFIPIRKPGKLPGVVRGVDYDLEYGSDRLEIHADALHPGRRILLIDDLLATGGTMRACAELATSASVQIVGMAFLIELLPLRGRERLTEFGPVRAVLQYD